MLTIDRLVLHLPGELAGRERTLGRAIGAALADYRPARTRTATRLAATLHDISPTMNDAAIAAAVLCVVTARLEGDSRRRGKGPSS
jgi:hypothetical protein